MSTTDSKQSWICICDPKCRKIEEELSRMKRRTIIEVAKVLPDDATVTQAECIAASEAAIAICCLASKREHLF